MKFVSNQPLGGSCLCSGIHTAPDRAPEGRGAWWGRHQGMAVHEQPWKSHNAWIIQISLHSFFGCRSQGRALVRRCCRWDGAGKGREQKAADGSRTEVTAPVANIPGKPGPPLAGGCVLKARGWESCSLCLFPFNHTSVCNLRQAGEEKRGRKKKKKGKRAQLFPPLPPPLSPPRPARSHVTVTQRCFGAAQPGERSGRRTPTSAQSRERKALGWESENPPRWKSKERHPAWQGKGICSHGAGETELCATGRKGSVLREKGKLSRRKSFIQSRLGGEKLQTLALPACRKNPTLSSPKESPRHHEHLPHPGGCLPLAGHHYSPAEDCEVQVLCW